MAGAISVDGRKEWTCKFCSESNVWTKWRCRRCYHDIPTGLRGKYRRSPQGLENGPPALRRQAGRKTESPDIWRQKIKSFGPGLQGLLCWRESGVAWRKSGEWIWTSRRRSRAAKKLDAHKRKLQNLENIERLSCVSKEVQESLKRNLQQPLQEVEQKRHDLMPASRSAEKITEGTMHSG